MVHYKVDILQADILHSFRELKPDRSAFRYIFDKTSSATYHMKPYESFDVFAHRYAAIRQ